MCDMQFYACELSATRQIPHTTLASFPHADSRQSASKTFDTLGARCVLSKLLYLDVHDLTEVGQIERALLWDANGVTWMPVEITVSAGEFPKHREKQTTFRLPDDV